MPRVTREAEETVLLRAGEALTRMGLDWKVLRRELPAGTRRPDLVLRLGYPGGRLDLAAEIKIGPKRDQVGALLAGLDRHLPRLLLADYVNPKLAEWLRAQGLFFLDAAGNAFLRDKGLYIWVTGQRDELRLRAERERRRAFQPSGLKLVFALLCRPALAETDYRTLAEAADIALGTVQRVMRDLVAEGYVLRQGRFRRRLVEPKALFDAWVPAYLRDLRPRLLLGRFEAPMLDWWKDTDPRDYDALWGGEPAAALLTRFLKPGGLTLYAPKIPARLVVDRKLEKKEGGRIEVRRKFWQFDDEEAPRTVPPVLVYADLQAVGDARAHEVAERVFAAKIDGPFRAHLARRPR